MSLSKIGIPVKVIYPQTLAQHEEWKARQSAIETANELRQISKLLREQNELIKKQAK